MLKYSRIVCFIALCSFNFATSAAGLLCSLSELDKVNSEQNPIEVINDTCHEDGNLSLDDPLDDCCHDMSICSGPLLIISNPLVSQISFIQLSIRTMLNERVIVNSSSPPVPPPRIS
jgi:hypothetical protein